MAVVVNEVTGNQSSAGHLTGHPRRHSWSELRGLVLAQAPGLSAPQAGGPGLAGGLGLCAVCRGPVSGRLRRCFQCDLHGQCAAGSLADVVLPVAYAPKGGSHATHLWRYKSVRARGDIGGLEAAGSALVLLALLLVFLREHGTCLWRAAGAAGPTHLAVVPTARGRPGVHPLRALIEPYLMRPWAELSARPDHHRVRDLDPDRFASGPVPGARVLLVDDTWTTGASAQSAAMALRRAGARSVATVVIGRHVSPGAQGLRAFDPEVMPFSVGSCGLHDGRGATGEP